MINSKRMIVTNKQLSLFLKLRDLFQDMNTIGFKHRIYEDSIYLEIEPSYYDKHNLYNYIELTVKSIGFKILIFSPTILSSLNNKDKYKKK